jgi:hypothetical protein
MFAHVTSNQLLVLELMLILNSSNVLEAKLRIASLNENVFFLHF